MQIMIGRTRTKARGWLRMGLSMPFIYGMAIPVGLLDFCTQAYQFVCFPLYGIEPVDRKRYVYCSRRARGLRIIDRLHCWYCAYVNGALNFIRAVAAETEKYWCPIRHVPKPGFQAPTHHTGFATAGDLEALKNLVTSYPYKK